MKNISLKYLLCIMMMIAALSFTACADTKDTDTKVEDNDKAGVDDTDGGEEDNAANVDDEDNAANVDDEDDTANAGDEDDTANAGDEDDTALPEGKFATMEEYVSSDEVQSQLSAMDLEGTGLKMEIKGENNKLIYRYTYEEIVKYDGLAETLSMALDTQADVFVSLATMCKSVVEVDNPVIVVEYIDANGELICSKEFSAEKE